MKPRGPPLPVTNLVKLARFTEDIHFQIDRIENDDNAELVEIINSRFIDVALVQFN